MAALSNAERAAVTGDYMRDKSDIREVVPLLKSELRAAINAADDWIDSNFTVFNAALPQPARGALSTQAKLDLFLRLLQRRVKGN